MTARNLYTLNIWHGMLCAENAEAIAERAQRIFADKFFTYVTANSYDENSERFNSVEVTTSQRLRQPFAAKIQSDWVSVNWSIDRYVCGISTHVQTETEAREATAKFDRVSVSFEFDQQMIINHYAPAGYRLQWQLVVEDHS